MAEIALRSAAGEYGLQIHDDRLLLHHPLPEVAPIPGGRVEAAIRQAVERPIAAAPLSQLANNASTVAVIVDDWARPGVTRHTVAPIILDVLNECGIDDGRITVVMARGVGLAPPVEAVNSAFRPALMGRKAHKEISNYHPSRLAFFGYSSLGTPIWIDDAVASADLRIGIGITFPSPWGGWSGGAKILVPGVAGAETIRQNHSLMVNVVIGSTDSQGLLDREEIADIVGLDLLVNLIVNLDGEIVELAAGDVRQTHRHLIEAYRRHYQVELSQKPDIIVMTLDRFQGYPMVNLYPFVDGCLPGAELVAGPGATLIAVGRCPEGIGAGMAEYMRTTYTMEDLACLKPQAGTLAFAAIMLAARFARCREQYSLVAVIDDLTESECREIGIQKKATLQEAVDQALEAQGDQAKVAILPGLGNISLPKLAPAAERVTQAEN